MKQLVIATNNKGKLKEIAALLPDTELLTLQDIGFIQDIPEPYHTFQENAHTKALTVHNFCHLPVLSDDSGITATVLNGRPGVDSAHFAGPRRSDTDNLNLLLQELQHSTDRTAWYTAILCFIDAQGETHYFEGRCYGTIAPIPQGSKGFGYDPIFIPDGYSQTFGELDESVKNSLSHRGKAVQLLAQWLQQNG